jgi:hypothetical protein
MFQQPQELSKPDFKGSQTELQQIAEHGVWDNIEYDEFSDSVVKITSYIELEGPHGSFEIPRGAGTGSVIKVFKNEKYKDTDMNKVWILTANHVTPNDDNNYKIKYQKNGTSPAKVVSRNTIHDVAILEAWASPSIKALELCQEIPKPLETVKICGYGNNAPHSKPNYYKAKIWRWHPVTVVCLEDVRPGCSGGPILFKGKVTGIVSAGVTPLFKLEKIGSYTTPSHGAAITPIKWTLDRMSKEDPPTKIQYYKELREIGDSFLK